MRDHPLATWRTACGPEDIGRAADAAGSFALDTHTLLAEVRAQLLNGAPGSRIRTLAHRTAHVAGPARFPPADGTVAQGAVERHRVRQLHALIANQHETGVLREQRQSRGTPGIVLAGEHDARIVHPGTRAGLVDIRAVDPAGRPVRVRVPTFKTRIRRRNQVLGMHQVRPDQLRKGARIVAPCVGLLANCASQALQQGHCHRPAVKHVPEQTPRSIDNTRLPEEEQDCNGHDRPHHRSAVCPRCQARACNHDCQHRQQPAPERTEHQHVPGSQQRSREGRKRNGQHDPEGAPDRQSRVPIDGRGVRHATVFGYAGKGRFRRAFGAKTTGINPVARQGRYWSHWTLNEESHSSK